MNSDPTLHGYKEKLLYIFQKPESIRFFMKVSQTASYHLSFPLGLSKLFKLFIVAPPILLLWTSS